MSGRLSRRTLATYVAKRLADGDKRVIDELAAFLIAESREREADILVRDIENQLAEFGELVITVESAHQIDERTKRQVKQMFADKKVHIREQINPELIGGVKITTPTQMLDQTVATRLANLRAMKV